MKKHFKKISILLIAISTFLMSGDVEAISLSVTQGDNNTTVSIGSTHSMFATIDGVEQRVYCAFHAYASPPSEVVSYEVKEINNKTGIGLAAIMEDTAIVSAFKGTENEHVVKTMAINLYLSEMDGQNRFISGNGTTHYNDSWWKTYAEEKKIAVTPFYGNIEDCGTTSCEGYKKIKAGFKNAYENNGDQYQKAVWELYLKAMNAQPDVEPYLIWDTSKEQSLELENGVYTGVYYVKSNVTLKKLEATVKGVSNATVNGDISTNTVTVSFLASDITGKVEDVEVIATATAEKKKSKVYTTVDPNYKIKTAEGEYKIQDFVVVGNPGFEDVVISTDDSLIPEFEPNICFHYESTCSDTACKNTNSNNTRTCNSSVTQYTTYDACDAGDVGTKLSGKHTVTLKAGVCSLYCKEEATAYYPGNIRPAITLGTNLEWPSSDPLSLQRLYTEAKMTCTIEMDNGGAVTSECQELAKKVTYNNGTNEAYVKYDDTKNDSATVKLVQSCTSSPASVSGSQVILTSNCNYVLENTNNMINKETYKFVAEKSVEASKAVTNYILIDKYKGVLPVAGFKWTDDTVFSAVMFKEVYDLAIEKLSLGYNNQFGTDLNANEYVCTYKVTTSVDGGMGCTCPPGTKYSGADLSEVFKGQSLTCAEAIETYCNTGIICIKEDGTKVDISTCIDNGNTQEYCNQTYCPITTPKVCPPNTTYSGYRYEDDASYKACKSGGGTDDFCIDLVCNCGSNCEYSCPPDSKYPEMDITTCVASQRGQGKNLTQALKTCESTLCNGDGGIGNIIYRTISLENPFPSKDADDSVNQSGLKTGMFNDLIKGRYPGTNWNSVTLVYNKILNNRGYDGSNLYYEATPLYTINLDPKAIKEIREYNKKQVAEGGYADFELECTNGAYCISSFLHDNIITTATGTPILDAQNSTCAGAHDKNSFISCYTTK